jgi:hypothetical protein
MSAHTNPAIASALDDASRACARLSESGCQVLAIFINPLSHQRPRVRIARPPQRAGLGQSTKVVTPHRVTYAALVAGTQVEWEVSK